MKNRSKKTSSGPLLAPLLRPVQDVAAATMFLSRLPVPSFLVGDYRAVSKCCWAFPIVGAIVGLLSGAVLWLGLYVGLSSVVVSLLTVMFAAFVTGALHEDGLGDVADGFWGGMTPQRRLEIMRDSQIGTYGTLSLIFISGLKIFSLAQIIETDAFGSVSALGLICIVIVYHVLARSYLPMMMRLLPLASGKGLAVTAGKPSWAQAFFALIIGGFGLYGFYVFTYNTSIFELFSLYLGLGILFVLFSWLVMRKLGGYNGDCLGALEQLGEAVILIMLVVNLA